MAAPTGAHTRTRAQARVGRPLRRSWAWVAPRTGPARQSLVALGLNSTTSLIAGAVLGAITGTLEELPGLLVLVPAAIGLRGNVFSALGNRLSTAIHTGRFSFAFRADTVLGQNLLASLALTLGMSLLLAVVAKLIAVALALPDTIPVLDLALVSVLGGLLASLLVLAATVTLAVGSVRYGWDLDNLIAPLVSTLGDVLTLPALWVATLVLGLGPVSAVSGGLMVALSAASLVLALRAPLDLLRRIVRESLPVLLAAGFVSAMAGLTIEKRFESFSAFPALLILVPAALSSAGALGGILSSRLSSKLHLGLVEPRPTPSRLARLDAGLVVALALPVFVANGAGAHLVGELLAEASPGLADMVAVSLIGGMLAMAAVVVIAYYGTVLAVRVRVDPDTYGIPIVTSTVDFVGAFSLILAITWLGVG